MAHGSNNQHTLLKLCIEASKEARPQSELVIIRITIIIRTFVTRAVSANILNLRCRQSLGEEDGESEV